MENIIKVPIVEELESSMLDYGMSVITDRALPSAEDGLKPVNRRILYDMFDKGYFNNKKFVKCAQPVGDTMGRFHPHGDSSIYGALAAMSQPWNMRYPLISWHGNNGSRDGDEPAAYRYTECKLSPIGEYMLEDIRKDTVDWQNAYTDEELEPIYLTGGIPNLEVNGTYGIAWSTACSFAPHNMNEIMDAAIYILNNPDCEVKDILKFIKGPDFPTAGKIINEKDLPSIYLTGKGRAVIRGEYEIEKSKKSDLIVFSSIPFKVSKEKLLKDIDDLCEKGTLVGIKSMRDETNHQGVRFVVETELGMAAQIVEKLFALTDLESSFSVNQVVLVDKKPQLLNTKELLNVYIDHQKDVLIRKSKFESKEISARVHILEGLLIALASIDEVIELIRKSESSTIAKDNLIKKYSLSEIQAKAILDMKLSRLAKLESIEIQKEKEEKVQRLNELAEIIANPVPELNKIFINIKNRFGDERRTSIAQIDVQKEKKIREKPVVEPEKVVVIFTEDGAIKRIPSTSFRAQNRNTKGVKSTSDIVRSIIRTNTVDTLLVFTNFGKAYKIAVSDIPVGTNASKGVLINLLIKMEQGEKPCLIYSVADDTKNNYVLFATEGGIVKRTKLEDFSAIRKNNGTSAIKFKEGDKLASVSLMNDEDVILLTEQGMAIRMFAKTISIIGKNAAGVKGITLKDGDKVVCALPIRDTSDSLGIFNKNGIGKRVSLSEVTTQNRGGKGIKITSSPDVIGGTLLAEDDVILISGTPNSICINAKDIPIASRIAKGNIMIKEGTISSVSKI